MKLLLKMKTKGLNRQMTKLSQFHLHWEQVCLHLDKNKKRKKIVKMSFHLPSLKIYASMFLRELKKFKKIQMRISIDILNKFIRNLDSMIKL
jgi:hypothetical protein